jgi:hypothetical protein
VQPWRRQAEEALAAATAVRRPSQIARARHAGGRLGFTIPRRASPLTR